jgi:fibronectin type 3 domain-containing protein
MIKIGKRSVTPARKRWVRPHLERLEARELLTFQHPGLLFTQADFDRISSKVSAGAQPWYSGWNALVNDPYSQLGANPRPLQTVIRGGTGANFMQMVDDIQRSFDTAVRWKVSGDTRYADQTVRYLNAWQYTMTTLTGNADRFLAAGIYGYQWANIADIMRTYSGWAAADVANFQNWLLTIYYPMSHDFLVHHNGAAISNYWANWDLCNMADVEGIGVFCDRQDLYNEAINYFYHGAGNGAIDKAVYYQFDGDLAQWQESGRDQGHTMFGLSTMAAFMQMAWNQGNDLWSYENNKFLMAAEYVYKYNLGYDVPFETYSWLDGQSGPWMQQTVISSASRGNAPPGFELIYNHYVNVMGLAAPYTTAWRAGHAPEGGSGNGDELGFGTLTYSLDPIAPGLTPSGLTAEEIAGGVTLNWWGEPYATSYNVYRSTSASGPFTQIAANITGPLTYTDQPSSPGVYFYKITGNEPGGETAASNVVQGTTVPALHTQLLFNESGGTIANDASGNGNNGTLMNGASFTGSSVRLNGSGQYVALPTGLVSNLVDFTIAAWVNLASNNANTRIFDFGDSNGRYMFLSPNNHGGLRYAFGLNYTWNEQAVLGPALAANQWVHVAVTQSGRTVALYFNGVIVASLTSQDFQTFQLGATVNDWIGRSQYPADPYLNGQVKDLRIYHSTLSANDIYTLATGGPYGSVPAAPANLTAWTAGDGSVGVKWAPPTGAASYNIYRSTTSGGPYTLVATGILPSRFIDTGLTNGVPYYYVVSAVSAAGEGRPSAEVSATPAAPAMPAAPTSLTAAAGNGVVILNWTASSGALSYNVKRATVSAGPYTTVASLLPTTSFIDRGLSNGTAYFYVVTAVSAGSVESSNSTEASGTPVPLPAGWSEADIGSPALTGYTRCDGFTWMVAGSGSDIWNSSDQFHFASRSLSGNGSIVARVAGVQNTNATAKAGVMFRDSGAASAMYALVAVTPTAGIKFEYRNSTGGNAASAGTVTGPTAPVWVRLTRTGNVFSGYFSTDGVTWTQIGGNLTINMSSNALVGLAVTAHNSNLLNTSTFDSVSVFPRLQFTVPATVTAGVPFDLTVTAQDSVNHTNTGYTGTVHFVASTGYTANYTFTAAVMGTHTFSGLVLYRAGTVTVTGTDTVNPSLTGSSTFTVTPAAPDHIALVLPPTISAGAPFALIVTVQDAYGNTVTDYQGTVHFTLMGPVTPAANYTFTAADMGSQTFNNLVLSQTGTYTLTGSDTMDSMLTGTVTFTVM